MFLEIHADTRRKTPYVYGLFRETFRQTGPAPHPRARHRPDPRAVAGPAGVLETRLPPGRDSRVAGTASREYGAAAAVLQVAKALGLERLLYSRREAWVCYVLAMIVGRVVYQGSSSPHPALAGLWPLCGVEENPPDVDAPTRPWTAGGAAAIQRALARRHLGKAAWSCTT